MLRKLKRKYFIEKLTETIDRNQTWPTLKSLLPNKSSKSPIPVSHDTFETANYFNNHFANVANVLHACNGVNVSHAM